jgi:hypothetical protein
LRQLLDEQLYPTGQFPGSPLEQKIVQYFGLAALPLKLRSTQKPTPVQNQSSRHGVPIGGVQNPLPHSRHAPHWESVVHVCVQTNKSQPYPTGQSFACVASLQTDPGWPSLNS